MGPNSKQSNLNAALFLQELLIPTVLPFFKAALSNFSMHFTICLIEIKILMEISF